MINIYDGQITDLFSNGLRHNPETIAIAYAVLQEKRRILALVERTRLMAAVDSLEERILDYLAVELRTPAYEDSLPLETKRTLIKGTLPYYASLGTPAAVDWVTSAIFGNGGMDEWFEYGGDPHHFRIHINGNHNIFSVEKFEEYIRAVYAVKRLSSWLDEVIITITLPPSVLHVGGNAGVNVSIGVPANPDVYDFKRVLYIGGTGGVQSSLGIPEDTGLPEARPSTVHTGGTFSACTVLPVPEDTELPTATTILRTGGVCTIISNLSGRSD